MRLPPLPTTAQPTLPSSSLQRLRAWLSRQSLPGTTLLAWRNLVHDRARFIVTLIGIIFSVVLMGVQLGLLVGFAKTASTLIDHTDADIWVTAAGTTNVDISAPISTQKRYRILSAPGVRRAEDYMVQFAFWKKPSGGAESVIVVGFSPDTRRGGPWRIAEGNISDIQMQGAVIVDELYKKKLGVDRIGQTVEINGQRARVVGFTQGIRTFTQSPYIFTTHANAQRFTLLNPRQTTYVLVEAQDPGAKQALAQSLARRMKDMSVWTDTSFAKQTQFYWLITTGAGSALTLAALLGLVVGIVIVGQTLYASTVDRLPEYATLRAMGAPHRYLYVVIMKQALISAAFGFICGFLAVLLMVWLSADGNIAIAMPAWLGACLALLTLLMCLSGAVFSIRRVVRIDPTSVFA